MAQLHLYKFCLLKVIEFLFIKGDTMIMCSKLKISCINANLKANLKYLKRKKKIMLEMMAENTLSCIELHIEVCAVFCCIYTKFTIYF